MSRARAYYAATEDGEGYAEYRESLKDPEYEADRLSDDYERHLDSQW